MATHAGHENIILVLILKADGASEHVILVLRGAARRALRGSFLCPWAQHAGPVQIWGCPRVADIEHLGDPCVVTPSFGTCKECSRLHALVGKLQKLHFSYSFSRFCC